MDEITKLSMTISKPKQSVSGKLREICSTLHKLVPQANRVSLWSLNSTKDRIDCHLLIDKDGNVSQGFSLSKNDFPQYFDAIIKHQVVNACDARNNVATACFNKSYFEPNDIHSLLDYIIHHDFEPVGIICCEATGAVVEWQDSHINALKRVANISSIFFASDLQNLAS
ncbi:GAF domain-containing protein [Thalassotalea sp. LPB0316]|uniref:GAF domain-containing protein n=1 Tax=Thalassotalea sp. LPB0316 TaxID=2769490 RepID=UPI0018666408|nr:GAF domain-containing protein [Thalassotalea sp. LPB0316]QOL24618.1 GAF domain-containing protein [Thalassotalea sp. LPB0316]